MNRRPLLVVGGWLVAVLVATGAGVVVTAFLGDAVTGSVSRALSPADVRRSLEASAPSPGTAGSPAAPASPTGPVGPPPASPSRPASSGTPGGTGGAGGKETVIAASGGVVVARCEGGMVTLRSWTPAQGYEVKDAERGPRDKVRVRFQGPSRSEVEVWCRGDRPAFAVRNG
ncbi:hypothetical protein ACFFWE_22480 [Sphaerisporangium melleum]|uniref:septum formation initiator n=1 Tax=Sphaerisporangium melleum TaxID=321316 RepID=UPI001664F0DD|nr:septum formation initiator [Sphaerisporangium melleum]